MLNDQLNTACRTIWYWLENSCRYDISQGEETLTDCLLLFLAQHSHKPNRIQVAGIRKTNKYEEHDEGIDWEWWIGNDREQWFRYAVQAKKLDLKDQRFEKQKYCALKKCQSENLQKYADTKGSTAIPIYALYNYVHEQDKLSDNYWHCCRRRRGWNKLGVTVTPLSNIKSVLQTRPRDRNFEKVHRNCASVPLRCLACPYLVGQRPADANLCDSWKKIHDKAQKYERLPKFYKRLFGPDRNARLDNHMQRLLTTMDLREYPEYSGRKNFPKRIGFVFVPVNNN